MYTLKKAAIGFLLFFMSVSTPAFAGYLPIPVSDHVCLNTTVITETHIIGRLDARSPFGFDVYVLDRLNNTTVLVRLEQGDHPSTRNVNYKNKPLWYRRGILVCQERRF